MARGIELLGRTVIDLSSGKVLGLINDALVSPDGTRLLGLVLDSGGWFHQRRIVPWEQVQTVGPDAVLVKSAAFGELGQGLPTYTRLTGMRVVSPEGVDLGVLDDLHFHVSSGQVTGYQLSGGLIEDALYGKAVVGSDRPLKVGQHAILLAANDGLPGGQLATDTEGVEA